MDTRSRILESALELFYLKGYDGAGVQEIVELAGIKKPTLYYYFGSKYGLLENVLAENYGDFHNELAACAKYEGNLEDNLTRIAKAYFRFSVNNHRFCTMMLSMMFAAEKSEAYGAVQPIVKDQFNIITDLFFKSKDTVGNMRGRQEQYAVGFTGLIAYYITYCSQKNMQPVSDRQVYEIVHQFLHGIYV